MARRILLADDSVTAQNMGRRILSDAGYEVITVNNGSAALKKATEQAPDVIVLDVYMPGYGGLEVCQRLKEMRETARIPVLLTVGKLEPFKPEEARRVRADAFIVKPFEATELLAALTKLEDRIVPSSDGPKGKKFSGDAGRNEEDSGWKNRLIIPPGGKGRSPEGLEDDFGQSEDSSKKSAKEEKPVAVASAEETVKAASEEKVVSIDTKAKANAQEESAPESKARIEESPKEAANAGKESKEVQAVAENKTETPAAVSTEAATSKEEVPPSIASAVAVVTAVAAAEKYSGPRWVAEEVTLSADDKAFPLDREMEKSFAATAAFEAGQKIAAEKKEETKAETVSGETAKETSEPVAAPVVSEVKAEEVKNEETKSGSKEAASSTTEELPVVAPPVETVTETSQLQEVASTESSTQSKGEAFAAAASAGSPAAEAVVAEVQAPAPQTEDNSSNKQQLAAAWEQWQNVRESVLNSPVAEQITQVAAATLKNAAESANTKADIEVTAAAPASNPTNIANIVDSVLAELKPKLVEEIAKQLNDKKK